MSQEISLEPKYFPSCGRRSWMRHLQSFPLFLVWVDWKQNLQIQSRQKAGLTQTSSKVMRRRCTGNSVEATEENQFSSKLLPVVPWQRQTSQCDSGLFSPGRGEVFFFFFWPPCQACGILFLWPGIKPESHALEAQNFNHWTSGKVPREGFSLTVSKHIKEKKIPEHLLHVKHCVTSMCSADWP